MDIGEATGESRRFLHYTPLSSEGTLSPPAFFYQKCS